MQARLLTADRFAAIILDFDGVIVDSENAQFHAWAWALKRFGIDTQKLELRHTVGWPDEDILKTIVAESSSELRPHLLCAKSERMSQMYQEGQVSLVSGVEEFIVRRSKTHVLAVVSNSRSGRIHSLLAHYDLARYFHLVISAGRGLPSKPDPAIYLETLNRLGREPEECMVIEDSIVGLAAAHAVGIYAVAITTTLDREDLAPYADWIIDSFDEIE